MRTAEAPLPSPPLPSAPLFLSPAFPSCPLLFPVALRDCAGSDEPTQSSSLSVLVPSVLALLTSSHSYRLSARPPRLQAVDAPCLGCRVRYCEAVHKMSPLCNSMRPFLLFCYHYSVNAVYLFSSCFNAVGPQCYCLVVVYIISDIFCVSGWFYVFASFVNMSAVFL